MQFAPADANGQQIQDYIRHNDAQLKIQGESTLDVFNVSC